MRRKGGYSSIVDRASQIAKSMRCTSMTVCLVASVTYGLD